MPCRSIQVLGPLHRFIEFRPGQNYGTSHCTRMEYAPVPVVQSMVKYVELACRMCAGPGQNKLLAVNSTHVMLQLRHDRGVVLHAYGACSRPLKYPIFSSPRCSWSLDNSRGSLELCLSRFKVRIVRLLLRGLLAMVCRKSNKLVKSLENLIHLDD